MNTENVYGNSRPVSDASLGRIVEVEGIRMHVTSIAEDGSRICHDRMAHRIWSIPASTRCLIVGDK